MNSEAPRPALPCDDDGAGEALLFVHAFPFDARMWAPQRDALAERFRVLTPDLRGFGRAGDRAPAASLDAHADDLAALLEARSVPAATVVGLSMGGYIALAFARRHPQRLAGLVLADTRAAPDGAEARAGRDSSIALVEREGTAALAQGLLPRLLAPGAPPELAARVRALAESQPPAGVVAALRAMRDRPDARPDLAALRHVPTLVLVGERDVVTTPDEARAMAASIPGARCKILPNAGHLANLEAPAAFNHAIAAMLEG